MDGRCIYNISYSLASEQKQSNNQMYFSQVCVLISDWNSRNLLSLEYSSSCLVVPYWTLDLAAADPLKSNKTMRTINKSSQKSDLKFNGPRKKNNYKTLAYKL